MELTAATFSFERHCRRRSDHENLDIVAQMAHTMDDNICSSLALYIVISVKFYYYSCRKKLNILPR